LISKYRIKTGEIEAKLKETLSLDLGEDEEI
jgi:hypothetical protein